MCSALMNYYNHACTNSRRKNVSGVVFLNQIDQIGHMSSGCSCGQNYCSVCVSWLDMYPVFISLFWLWTIDKKRSSHFMQQESLYSHCWETLL